MNGLTAPALRLSVVARAALVALAIATMVGLAGMANLDSHGTVTRAFIEHPAFGARRI